jgi:RNA polymerase sigma factor for flagellar operon FliA
MYAATQTTLETTPEIVSLSRRDELISEHFHLVKATARRVQKSLGVHIELEDLVHAGTMGLFEAATKYQDDKQVPFPVYAKHRIRGAILDSLRQLDWASRDARKQYKRIETVTNELTMKLGRTPSQPEVAEAMGIDQKRWQSLMMDFRTFGLASVQRSSADREDQPAKEIPASPALCPDHVLAKSELKRTLKVAMETLPQRYRQVVTLYYEADMSMKEIGGMLGVNESRVSQIHKSALAKMQVTLGKNGFRSSAAVLC